jgi:hypothetical protein
MPTGAISLRANNICKNVREIRHFRIPKQAAHVKVQPPTTVFPANYTDLEIEIFDTAATGGWGAIERSAVERKKKAPGQHKDDQGRGMEF